jgi:DNA-binding Xre family transcriptional regulator
MAASYNKLWKLLIDRKMTKTQLVKLAGITTNAMAKLGRNEDVRVEVLIKICSALGCTMDDIMDIVPDKEAK